MSCQEEDLPAPFIGEPVFYVSASLDGDSFTKTAGENGYFMSTSYFFDANFNHLNGTLEQPDCDACHESISFTISTTPVVTDPLAANSTTLPQVGVYDFASTILTTGGQHLVEIAYTTPDDIIFCSNQGPQTQGVFEITAIEDFENNNNGQATKKLHIRFVSDLYDGIGNVKRIDGTGIIIIIGRG